MHISKALDSLNICFFRQYLRLVCGDDGQWYGPRCVKDACSPLPVMFAGAYTCTDGINVGSFCTMSCPSNPKVFEHRRFRFFLI